MVTPGFRWFLYVMAAAILVAGCANTCKSGWVVGKLRMVTKCEVTL